MGKRDIDNQINVLKEQICGYFVGYLESTKATQRNLAKKMKLNGALLSKIVRNQHQEFTLDRLLRLLNVIRPDIVPVLKKSSKAIKQKRKNL